jgi:hypothetical protein
MAPHLVLPHKEILALQRAAGNAAVAELLKPPLPPELTAPYHPGESSKRYWELPPERRSAINAQTDTEFQSRSGITHRLNQHNPKDRPAVRMWLRIRDEQVAVLPVAEVAPVAEIAPGTEIAPVANIAPVTGTTTTAPPPAPVAADAVGELIAKHQTFKFLDEEGLAKDLAGHLPSDANFVATVIKTLYWWHQRDATSIEVCKLESDADLAAIAADSSGQALLLYMVSEMQGVHTSADDKTQAQRVMRAISKANLAKSGHVEIEVLTFRRGFAPLDWAGEKLFGKGAKGHTAVVAGGIAYSFDERGWIVAGTKNEYLAENTYRDAIGQVLDVPEPDAEKVQAALDASVGSGTYLINKGSHVCTDEAARTLEFALGKLEPKHNPQEFAKTLEASGRVKKTNDYPKK